jgi:hypothetical protein
VTLPGRGATSARELTFPDGRPGHTSTRSRDREIDRSRDRERWTSQCSFAGFSLCRSRSSPRVLSGRPSSSGGGILSACPRSVFDGRWSTTREYGPAQQHIRRPSCLAKNAVQICFLGSPFSGDCGGSVSGNLPLSPTLGAQAPPILWWCDSPEEAVKVWPVRGSPMKCLSTPHLPLFKTNCHCA